MNTEWEGRGRSAWRSIANNRFLASAATSRAAHLSLCQAKLVLHSLEIYDDKREEEDKRKARRIWPPVEEGGWHLLFLAPSASSPSCGFFVSPTHKHTN
jgi:hypothetical protein